MQIVKYMFQPHGDERGMLVALEEFNDAERKGIRASRRAAGEYAVNFF